MYVDICRENGGGAGVRGWKRGEEIAQYNGYVQEANHLRPSGIYFAMFHLFPSLHYCDNKFSLVKKCMNGTRSR